MKPAPKQQKKPRKMIWRVWVRLADGAAGTFVTDLTQYPPSETIRHLYHRATLTLTGKPPKEKR